MNQHGTYIVTIEVDDNRPLTADDVDDLHESFDSFDVALGMSPRGWRSVTLSTPAEGLKQAAAIATAVVQSALGANAIACEIMTEAEFDIRQGWAPVPELVSVSQAAELLGVSRQRVLQRIQEHSLPATRVGRDYVIPRAAIELSGVPAPLSRVRA